MISDDALFVARFAATIMLRYQNVRARKQQVFRGQLNANLPFRSRDRSLVAARIFAKASLYPRFARAASLNKAVCVLRKPTAVISSVWILISYLTLAQYRA